MKSLKSFANDLGPYLLGFIALVIAFAAYETMNLVLPAKPDTVIWLARVFVAGCVPAVLAVLICIIAEGLDKKFHNYR